MNAKGIGLGLVISKMITEEFGGETCLISQHTKGSIFISSFLLEGDGGLVDEEQGAVGASILETIDSDPLKLGRLDLK